MVLEHEALTERIIGAAIEVHRPLGPGFLESVYEKALIIELKKRGLALQNQMEGPTTTVLMIVRVSAIVSGKGVAKLAPQCDGCDGRAEFSDHGRNLFPESAGSAHRVWGLRRSYMVGRPCASRCRAAIRRAALVSIPGGIMTSPLKVASNRRNSLLSTGPSEESRAWTRFNGLTLGLRSKSRLLPGETEEDFGKVKDTWVISLNPQDSAECALVDDIIMADWFHQCALRIHHQHLMAYIAGARTRADIQVDKDINLLFHDRATGHHATYGIGNACCGGPRTSVPDKSEDAVLPAELVIRLESSERGCQALFESFQEIRTRLVENLPIQSPDKLKLIRMLGKQPLDAGADQRIWLIFMASFALHPAGKDHAFEDLKSDLTTPELEAFLDRILSRWPAPFDAADTPTVRNTMLALVDQNLERLEAKLEVYRGMADEQGASPAGCLAFDQSPDGERLRRHELACGRRLKQCQNAFWKHRREMERTEDGGRRAEDGGEEPEKIADSSVEPGAAGDGCCVENKNLTTEANGGLPASESELDKEIAAKSKVIFSLEKSLADMRARGIGAAGTEVVGGESLRSLIEKEIFSSGLLMRS